MNSIYCKNQKENGNTFLLKMVKMDDHIAFLILEESGAYLGKATNNYLKETAAYFSVDTDAYISDLEKFINVTVPDVKIRFTDDRFSIIKKVGKLNIKYLSIELKQVNFAAMAMNLATELLNLSVDANRKVLETNDKLLQAQACKDIFKEKLESYTKEHINSENQLYSSFLLILNEKKRQLQFYKDLLAKAQTTQVSKSPTRILLSEEENSNEYDANIDTNNNDEDYNTDEEKDIIEKSANNGCRPALSGSLDSEGEPLAGPSKTKSGPHMKYWRPTSFDSEEPLAGPSKTKCIRKMSRKKWKSSKPDNFSNQSNKSANNLNSRPNSTSNLNVKSINDFDMNLEDFREEFNLSDTEITPLPKLPRRIKSASSTSALVKHSPINSQFVQTPTNQESPEVVDDSPTLHFNTQDLWDRI